MTKMVMQCLPGGIDVACHTNFFGVLVAATYINSDRVISYSRMDIAIYIDYLSHVLTCISKISEVFHVLVMESDLHRGRRSSGLTAE